MGSIRLAQRWTRVRLVFASILALAMLTSLQAARAQQPTEKPDVYIVALEAPAAETARSETARQAATRRALDSAQTVLKARGIASRAYRSLPYLRVEVADLEALLALKGVLPIAGVYPVRWNTRSLDQSLPLIRQPQALALGASGAGLAVAVLDTGADYQYASLGSCAAPGPTCRVVHAFDAAPNDGARDDPSLHGTNVASIAAAVAPQAKIVAIDVFDGENAADDDILDALDWVNVNRAAYRITAVNLSLGDPTRRYAGDCDSKVVYDAAFRALRAAGIVVVAAAGNDGDKAGIQSPACHSKAIAVGATTDAPTPAAQWPNAHCRDPDLEVDRPACFSDSADPLDVMAPGVFITTAGITMAGTSQASPHVAGAVAALRSAQPSLTPDEIAMRLRWTGQPITDRNGLVRPRLDLVAALEGRLDTPPVAKDDAVSVLQGAGAVVDVLANDLDEAPGELTVISFTQIANGRVARNGERLVVLVDAGASQDQVFDYTIRDRFGRTAGAQVRVKVLSSSNPAGRPVTPGPALWSTALRIDAQTWMLLWTEGSGQNVLQCQQSLDAAGAPTSNADTCVQLKSDGKDLVAASSGVLGDYMLAWHEDVAGRKQVLTRIHRYPVLGGPFVASTPNTYGSVEALGPPAIAAWPTKVLAVWPEWSSVPTFYARAYANNVSAGGGYPSADRVTLIKNYPTPTGHRVVPRADGGYLHVIERFRELSIMAHGPDGLALWPARVVVNPPQAQNPGGELTGWQVAALANGGFVVAWAAGGSPYDNHVYAVGYQRYRADGVIAGPMKTLHTSNWSIKGLGMSASPTGEATLAWSEVDFRGSTTLLATLAIDAQGATLRPVTPDYWAPSVTVLQSDLDVDVLPSGRRHLTWREGPLQGPYRLKTKIVD